MKYQGIYNTVIIYLSKILRNTLGLFPVEFISRVGIDCCFNCMCLYGIVFARVVHVSICAHNTDPSGEKLFPGSAGNECFTCQLSLAIEF